jgi:hypothetical protein
MLRRGERTKKIFATALPVLGKVGIEQPSPDIRHRAPIKPKSGDERPE